jgi:hypothetical protein
VIYDSLKSLDYEQIPDYDMIIMKLTEVMHEFGIGTADPYDWDTLDEQALSAMSIGPMMKRKVDEFEPAVPPDPGGGISDQILLSSQSFPTGNEEDDTRRSSQAMTPVNEDQMLLGSPSFATVTEEGGPGDWRLCCCRKCNI